MKIYIPNLLFWVLVISFISIIALLFFWIQTKSFFHQTMPLTPWQFRSVDTMKLSRDLAREKLNDPSFDKEIETQVKNIADTGATHIGIGSPYDEEFLPFLKKWVVAARKNHLKVWFRGNWSSWEGWFGYDKKMTFEQHLAQTTTFIKQHPDLFENGDAFTGCPECENGAQGDPRMTGKVDEYRKFLIEQHIQSDKAFKTIGKVVNTSFMSMNKDVADLIMDEATAKGVGGYVTIDHYVGEAKRVARDVNQLAEKTKAKIVLGEFGAPIPDLNGEMTEEQQAEWIDEAMNELLKSKNLYGISYWVNKGGSTAIWNDDNTPKKAVSILTKYFLPMQLYGSIQDELGFKVNGVLIEANNKQYNAEPGEYLVPLYGFQTVTFIKEGYDKKTVTITKAPKGRENITLKKQNPGPFYSFWTNLRKTFFN